MGKNVGYYYCSLETANSILKNHSLRFSNPLKMNDGDELIWFYEKMFKCSEYAFNHPMEIKKNSFSSIKTVAELIKEGQRALYCLCLSKEKDLLSLWRGYAEDGAGVAIGININQIKDDEKYMSSFDISYSDTLTNVQKEKVQQNIWETEKTNSGTENTWPLLYANGLLDEAIKYKSPFFSEEKEVRLLLNLKPIVNTPKRDELIKTRKDEKFNTVDYYEKNFKEDSITEIVLGPKNRIRKDCVLDILEGYGYNAGDIIITKSCGNYR